MSTRYSYEQSYVRFFLRNNGLATGDDPADLAEKTLADPRFGRILADLADWPAREIKNHKDVDHPLHKLSFLAELGFTVKHPKIKPIVEKVVRHQSEEGPFQLSINIPAGYGGPGKPVLSWIMSDAPVLLYALIKLNDGKITPPIRKGVDFVAGLVSENGWHCVASPELGKFRGPGAKNDPCPYATMFSLKMLGLTGKNEYQAAKKTGLETLVRLWKERTRSRPYLFAMGTDFMKLKLPLVWYDALNMLDTLSLYPEVYKEKFFKELLAAVNKKRTKEGFVPESVYLKSGDWDFGQKKRPSEFMNAVIERIEARIDKA